MGFNLETINKHFIPADLSEQEQQIWSKLAPQLIELEILNSLNYLILVRYCKLYVQTQNYMQKYPANVGGLKELNKQLKQIEEELCLTPATFNKWQKDRLIIEERKRKQEKHNIKLDDSEKEKFFE